jgi:ribosomal protein L11 methyltransferase
MSWLQIHLTTAKAQAPLVELLLESLGALSVTLGDAGDSPLLEPGPGEQPLWEQTRITGLFSGDTEIEPLRQALEKGLAEQYAQLEVERLEDRVWERVWLENFRPMRFGTRLWICPDNMRPEESDAVVVELDPGLAFGTGTHPTTALCLEWLDRTPLEGKRIVDFGCGSGILAIAALRLGADVAIALDHDPQALQASRDNAEKNGVLERLEVLGSDRSLEGPADILLANILAGTLISLQPVLAAGVKPGGKIVLSGILEEQWQNVADAFAGAFTFAPPTVLEDWVLLEGTRL